MRKTAILTSVAGLFLLTAPAAFAQDPATQTPPTSPEAAQPAPSGTVSLQPGASVKGSDGTTLGTLEGARQGPSGQEITVRGSDGQLRGVPVAGLTQSGADVSVAWSSGEFNAAPAIGATSPSPEATPTLPEEPSGPPPAPTESSTPTMPEPTDPATPPTEEPSSDDAPTTPDSPNA